MELTGTHDPDAEGRASLVASGVYWIFYTLESYVNSVTTEKIE